MLDIQAIQARHLVPLGKQIRALRRALGLTQADLAQRIPGVARQDLSGIETGRFTGSVVKVASVVDALRYQVTIQPYRYPTMYEIDDLYNRGTDDD